jgi:hypothetical protein
MTTIVLRTANPLDIPPKELDDLAQAIRDLDPDYRVEVTSGDPRGVAVTWWEVIACSVPWDDLRSAAAGAVVAETISWLRRRFQKAPRRPKSVSILGPTGTVLKRVVLKTPDDESEELA